MSKITVDLHTMGVCIAVIIFVLCTPTSAPTRQNETLRAQEPEAPLEEVLVIGDRPILQQLPEYKRKMRQVAEEHPEFLEAIIQYSKILELYKEATGRGRDSD